MSAPVGIIKIKVWSDQHHKEAIIKTFESCDEWAIDYTYCGAEKWVGSYQAALDHLKKLGW